MTDGQAGNPVTYAVGGPGVVWRETGGEIVILDIEGSVYFGLNASAADLWNRLTVGATRADLTAVLASSARVMPERAEQDVDDFLTDLSRYGFLHQR